MAEIKEAVNDPEHLQPYIRLAVELHQYKECGARFHLDDLTECEWACLFGIQEGINRGQKQKRDKEKAEYEAYMRAQGRTR